MSINPRQFFHVRSQLFRHRPLRKRIAVSAIAMFGLTFGWSESIANESLVNKARSTITSEELRRHVDVLADDTFEGREAGSRGGRAAANYIMQFLKERLEPAGTDGAYHQPFGAGYRNLLAKVTGTDPQLKNEYILIGAHYDHVGYGNRQNSYGPFGYIHNGADDNASGTAALLEVLDAFARSELQCKRTVIFAFWDGEEKGLLGSEHWASNPTVPINNVKLAINMDMIGRLRDQKVEVFGSRSMSGLRSIVSQANSPSNLQLDFKWEVKDNSDHHSFFRRRIPILMFHTGLHSNYHRPSDDAHLVNAEGIQEVSALALSTVYTAADADHLSGFRLASRREGTLERRRFERPLANAPARLGIAWNPEPVENGGFRITRVSPGSAADRGGLRVGDVMVAFNGEDIGESKRLQGWVATAEPAVQFTLARNDGPQTVDVELAGRPTRLGISWREDNAEPGTVAITRVIPSSPAHFAGLRPKDRIRSINQERFANSKELLKMALSLPMPIELEIERKGQIQMVTLESLDTPALPQDQDAIDESPESNVSPPGDDG